MQALPRAIADSVEQVQRFITDIFALQPTILAHADTPTDPDSFQAAVKAMQMLDVDCNDRLIDCFAKDLVRLLTQRHGSIAHA